MPVYEFSCPRHETFEVFTRGFTPPAGPACPVAGCCEPAQRIISVPARVNIKRSWNDKANDYRRDPYTQSKAQLVNTDRSNQERGKPPMRITEEAIQAGARAIDEQNARPREDIEQRHVKRSREITKKVRQERGKE